VHALPFGVGARTASAEFAGACPDVADQIIVAQADSLPTDCVTRSIFTDRIHKSMQARISYSSKFQPHYLQG